jgi:hypothetical protein
MLGKMLKNLVAPRPAPAGLGAAAPTREEEAVRCFESALEHARAGRIADAIGECNAALAIQPNFTHAHLALAELALPGENYFHVLARIHAHLKPRTYVEIGVAQGDSIRMLAPGTQAIGVDPDPRVPFVLPPGVRVFAETSDDFFANHDVRAEFGGLPVDLAFIDGMHRFEFALRDFINLEALCTPDSTILIHDVYPLDERTAARDRVTNFWSGDIWRLVLLLRERRPDLAVHTVAAAPTGLGIVRNLDPHSRYLRDHLDELVQSYLAMDFGVLNGCKAERLALFPNDWPRIASLFEPRTERVGA